MTSNRGLTRTLDALTTSENLASMRLLLDLFFSGPDSMRDATLERLLARHHRDLFSQLVIHFHRIAPRHREKIIREGARLGSALRAAYLDPEPQTRANSHELIRLIPSYDEAPLLLSSLMAKDPAKKAPAIELLDQLAQSLHQELQRPAEERTRRDLEAVRERFLDTLRQGMRKFVSHRCDVVVRAFLLLAPDESPEVLRIVSDGSDPCHRPVVSLLRSSAEPLMMRWIFHLMRGRHSPIALLNLLAQREDWEFVTALLDRIDLLSEQTVSATMRRVNEIRWIDPERGVIPRLCPEHQRASVILAVHSGISVEAKLSLCAYLLDEGSPDGRRSAACGLSQIPGVDANSLIQTCLEDEDPEVQLAAIQMLRPRGIANAMGILLARLDDPDERIADAARQSLADYNFERYLASFDQMEDLSRRSMGRMILKIDRDAVEGLRRELSVSHRQHRLRAIRIVRILQLIDDYVPELIASLSDGDHLVRREIMETLLAASGANVVDLLADQAAMGSAIGFSAAGGSTSSMPQSSLETLEYLRKAARDPAQRVRAQVALDRLAVAASG